MIIGATGVSDIRIEVKKLKSIDGIKLKINLLRMIRVGRYPGGNAPTPSYPNFEKVIVMMKSHSAYYPLSPYELKNEQGQIMENIWQFKKVYQTVPESQQKYSRFNNTIIWSHPAETHVDTNGNITPEYLQWRTKGLNNPYPVRYPVGYRHRHACLYSLDNKPDGSIHLDNHLDYVEARKKIYVKEYCRLVRNQPLFQKLQTKLANGTNLLIIEVDGPHTESMPYYKDTYQVDNNFIENDTMLVTQQSIQIMLNDTKHPFGHGYCLAMALLNKDHEWNQ